jgi:hypothetical protein
LNNELELLIRTHYIQVLKEFTRIHGFKLVMIEAWMDRSQTEGAIYIAFWYSNLINLNNIPFLNSDLR